MTNLGTNFSRYVFSQEERLLLYLTIHLHDIGCILGRDEHHKSSLKLLEHHRFSFLEDMIGKDLLSCLRYTIAAHSSNYELSSIPTQPIHSDVRLRLICALFRLLDECEISSARTSRVLYDILTRYSKLKPKNAIFWEAHLGISSVVFYENKIVVDCENLTKTRLLIKHLRKQLDKVNRIFAEESFPKLSLEVVKLRLK